MSESEQKRVDIDQDETFFKRYYNSIKDGKYPTRRSTGNMLPMMEDEFSFVPEKSETKSKISKDKSKASITNSFKKQKSKDNCPVCNEILEENREKVIECNKCRSPVHYDCDRVINNENLEQIKEGNNKYLCPHCRAVHKNSLFTKIIKELTKQDIFEIFVKPVDVKATPEYLQVIKHPMCFKWMLTKTNNKEYLYDVNLFFEHLDLIFTNAFTFNGLHDPVYRLAQDIKSTCDPLLEQFRHKLISNCIEYLVFDLDNEKLNEKFNEVRTKINNLLNTNKLLDLQRKCQEYHLPETFLNQFLDVNQLHNNYNSDLENSNMITLRLDDENGEEKLNNSEEKAEVKERKNVSKKENKVFKSGLHHNIGLINSNFETFKQERISLKKNNKLHLSEKETNDENDFVNLDEDLQLINKDDKLNILYSNKIINENKDFITSYIDFVLNCFKEKKVLAKNSEKTKDKSKKLFNKKVNRIDANNEQLTTNNHNHKEKEEDIEQFDERNENDLYCVSVAINDLNLISEPMCFTCGSFDSSKYFICCNVCKEYYHSFCISPSLSKSVDKLRSYEWKCPNCKYCEICKKAENDHLLLFCDCCDKSIHTYCSRIKMYVSPKSEWKCGDCFKCDNCGTNDYHKPDFPINKDKDYSIFTRNFSLCYECGYKSFRRSFCTKCEKSDFPRLDHSLKFIEKRDQVFRNDYENENSSIIYHIVCHSCNCWFHLSCLGFEYKLIHDLYNIFDEFICVDCHLNKKYPDNIQEVQIIQYFNLIKMSFSIQCFSKIIIHLMKTYCKDSSIKLHSKLIKVFLKENYHSLINDKSISFLLDNIIIDICSLKENNSKKSIKVKEIKQSNAEVNNVEEELVINMSNLENLNNHGETIESLKEFQNKTNMMSSLFIRSNQENSPPKENFLYKQAVEEKIPIIINIPNQITGHFVQKTKKISKKKTKKRIRLVNESVFKREVHGLFFKKDENINNNCSKKDFSNIVDLYNFDLNDYLTNEDGHLKGRKFIETCIMKFQKYMKIPNISILYKKLLTEIYLQVILKINKIFLIWLMKQILENGQNSDKIKENYRLYPSISKQKEDYIFSLSYNEKELNDEEFQKISDYIDPLIESPLSNKTCELCQRKGERELSGRLVPYNSSIYFHFNCIRWSKNTNQDKENFFKYTISLNKSLLKCSVCNKDGATINCENKKCNKSFHFLCSLIKRCHFTQELSIYCPKCIPSNKEEEQINLSTFSAMILHENETKEIMYGVDAVNRFGNSSIFKICVLDEKSKLPTQIDIVIMKSLSLNNTNKYILFILNSQYIGLIISESVHQLKSICNNGNIQNCFQPTNIDFTAIAEMFKDNIIYLPTNESFEITKKWKTSNPLFSTKMNGLYSRVFKFLFENVGFSEKFLQNKEDFSSFQWLKYFNIFQPFSSLITKGQISGNYGITYNLTRSDSTQKGNKKALTELEAIYSVIKAKNETFKCFKSYNYIENFQMKKFNFHNKKAENELIVTEKKNALKSSKQTYNNLEKTRNTNIFDPDIPISMKFRNFKEKKPKLTIGSSKIHRNGLYAMESFKAGEIVIEYVGEVISNRMADFREKEYNLRGYEDCYFFRLDSTKIIDATNIGNLARFINHCCDPNCAAEIIAVNDVKHIILYAKRDIKQFEEITYDYNFELEAEKIECHCGAETCIGRMN